MPGHYGDVDLEEQVFRRIVAEYIEMPGLQLTIEQARRLWGCDIETCQRVATVLVEQGVLRWSRNGRLIRGS